MWTEHKRDDSRMAVGEPTMSFRRGGIAFNGQLIRAAHATDSTRATLFFDEQKKRVGVRFHSRSSPNAYVVRSDGGHAATGRWLQVGRIYDLHPWLAEVLDRPSVARRFTAQHDSDSHLWYVEVR
jgi:hypothetical protein